MQYTPNKNTTIQQSKVAVAFATLLTCSLTPATVEESVVTWASPSDLNFDLSAAWAFSHKANVYIKNGTYKTSSKV